MSYSKLIRHLLPRSEAWKTAIARNTTKLLDGFGEGLDDVREYCDQIFYDQFPETTRFVSEWEKELGIPTGVNDAASRANISAAQKATGGQSPKYIQDVIHAAGFTTVFVHEPWESTDPYSARDPRVFAQTQYYGGVQFATAVAGQHLFTAKMNSLTLGENAQPLFNGISLGSNYLDNDTLQRRVIPSVPDDPQYWPFFLYIAGETFPNPAVIDMDRRSELLRLLLQLRPLHMWLIFMLTGEEADDDYFMFEAGDGFEDSVWYPYG